MKKEDNQKRMLSRQKTLAKRKNQDIHIYKIKFQKNKLSKEKKDYLNRLFLEAKWFYNFCLSEENDVFKDRLYNNKEVQVKVKDTFENRQLIFLSSHMRQEIQNQIKSSIKTLSTKKKKGKYKEVGKLKFKSKLNMIPLKTIKYTYRIKNNKLYLQGFKKGFKVNGLNQLKDSELANAKLLKRDDDYYIYITGYTNKENNNKEKSLLNSVGIDFGIKDNLILSNGEKINIQIKESKRIKRLSKKINKSYQLNKTIKTNNRKKLKVKLRKEYQKNKNKKTDISNKVLTKLNEYVYIYIQDENIKSWHKMKSFSRKVQYSNMGGIIRELKNNPRTLVLDRFTPTTKLCPVCNKKINISLSDRIFTCECGYTEDRDIKSALTIQYIGMLKQIAMEHSKFKPVERLISEFKDFYLASFGVEFKHEFKLNSMKQEA